MVLKPAPAWGVRGCLGLGPHPHNLVEAGGSEVQGHLRLKRRWGNIRRRFGRLK